MSEGSILRRLIKEKSKDVMHSSAYGEAQNAGNMGVASTQGFEERQEIEANRTVVEGYKDSRVVNDAFGNVGTKLTGYDASHDASQRMAIREKFGGERKTGVASETHGGISENSTNNRMSGFNRSGGLSGAGRAMPSGRTGAPPARRNPGISR